jgi:hypothetical protein
MACSKVHKPCVVVLVIHPIRRDLSRSIRLYPRFLQETYLPKMNGKFSRPAFDPADAPVPLGKAALTEILCFEYDRVGSNDYVVRFECRLFQIYKSHKVLPRPRDNVTVRIRLDGSYSILFKGKPLLGKELHIPPKGHISSSAA